MRRQFGPRGGVARQDVSAATDGELSSDDDVPAASAAYGEAKKRKEKRGGALGAKKKIDTVEGAAKPPISSFGNRGEGIGANSVRRVSPVAEVSAAWYFD